MAISKIDSKALTDSSVVDADIADGTITSAKLAGSVANAKLQNSTVTINGTAVALGASASLDAISWQAVKTAAFNAVAGEGYFVNTTSGAITVTLPASPSIGDTIAIKDYAGTYATNNLTIARNGKNIQGVANDSLISTNRASLILVFVDDTKGWVYTVESNVGDLKLNTFIEATGGTVTTVDTDYKVHTFTGDGCFVVSSAGHPTGSTLLEYIVVAGGGGGVGQSGNTAGGGGAGGFRFASPSLAPATYPGKPLAAPTALTAGVQTYPVTVGGGGAACGSKGANSVFSTITSAGGGYSNQTGGSGGGGSGGSLNNPGGAGNTPPVSPSQGNNGGTSATGSPDHASGGGGGAIAVGGNGKPANPGSGPGGIGAGMPTGFGSNGESSGGFRYYAGGGGGGGESPVSLTAGTGGIGGGATGGVGPGGVGSAGTANTGGGGGSTGSSAAGGAGGSGIVIIRYKFQ
jgi:hypothetical protein